MDIKNLKKVRIDSGFSYQDMAESLGITLQAYWMIENGKRGLSYVMAVRIAKALDSTPDEIFLNKGLTCG